MNLVESLAVYDDDGWTALGPKRQEQIVEAARAYADLRDFIERMIGYYDADQARSLNPHRREGQIIACAEILRFMDGNTRMSEQLADMVPVGLADLPARLGGTAV